MIQRTNMNFYVIYFNTSDYPNKWVVRQFTTSANKKDIPGAVRTFEDLAEARAAVPRGLFCIPRYAIDDSVIVETWL